MSLLNPHDEFYILPDQRKIVRKAQLPEPWHIECLNKLEDAAAALNVSDEPIRSRKSSLAKPREDNVSGDKKSVSFSEHVSIRTIPARKPPILTGLDLYDIMAATDDEFASFLGKGRQPDSPAPWQQSSSASWRLRERRPTALPAGARILLRLPSTCSSQVKPMHSRQYSSFRHRALATQPSIPAWLGGSSRIRGAPAHRACAGLRNVDPIGLPTQYLGDIPTLQCTSSSICNRQAFLRHLRQVRQQRAAHLHGTPLRRRQVRRHGLASWLRPGYTKPRCCMTRCRTDINHHTDDIRTVARLHSSFPSLLIDEEPRWTMPPRTTQSSDTQLARSAPQRVRTYVDHIREQRSPPRALHAHFVSEPFRKVSSAVSI